METRRAYFRNMRSKCRCSCVLQFTWHLGVSSVLHRPLSQIIHCIVLYLDFQTATSECLVRKANNTTVKTALQGEITTQTTGRQALNNRSCTQSPSHSQQANRQTYQSATEELCYQIHQTGCTARTRDPKRVSVPRG